jgi:hypothetical protein
MMMGATNSHAQSANQSIDGNVRREGLTPNTKPTAQDTSLLNHEIKESIIQATRESEKKKKDDLRSAIFTSATDNGIYYESNNQPSLDMKDFDVDYNRRKGIVAHSVEKAFEVKNYGLAQPPENMRRLPNTDYEWYSEESKRTPVYKASVRQYLIQTPDTAQFDQDNDRFEFGVYNKA